MSHLSGRSWRFRCRLSSVSDLSLTMRLMHLLVLMSMLEGGAISTIITNQGHCCVRLLSVRRRYGEPNTDVAYRRGPPHLMHKGNLYTRKEHQDNTRAYSKASIIWQFGDEYARTVNGQQKKYWRCGLRDRTTILVMSDNSSSGLRHLKKNHGIDKDRQRQTSQITVILRLSDFSICGFWEKPLHPTVPDFSQAPRHPQSAVHLLLEHTVALDLFSTRIIFCSSVHSSYSFHCCPQVLIRLMTLAFNLGLTYRLSHGCSRALISDVFATHPKSSCQLAQPGHYIISSLLSLVDSFDAPARQSR
jgi:hypothetical protein